MQTTAANHIEITVAWSSCPRFGPPVLDLQTSTNRINQRESDNQQTVPPAAVRFRYGKLRGSNRKHTSTKAWWDMWIPFESRQCYQHWLSTWLPKPAPVTARTADSTVLTCRLKAMTKCAKHQLFWKLSFHRDGVYKLICMFAASLGENPFYIFL